MVMQNDRDWPGLYRQWQQEQAGYISAQRALDDSVTLYMQAKGAPPSSEQMQEVAGRRERMLQARAAVNQFIADRVEQHTDKHNLPRHE